MLSDTFGLELRKTHYAASGPALALDEVSLEVPAGAVTLVMGRSGSGKSTLLRLMAAIDRPDAGVVSIAGVEVGGLPGRRRRAVRTASVGYVFSRPSDNLLPYLTASAQLDLAADLRGIPRTTTEAVLAQLGLADRGANLPAELSGGERQRLAFGAAAMGSPQLFVADEPTAELDSASVAALLAPLVALAEAGSAVLVATHDERLLDVADQVVSLEAGRRVA